MSGNSLGSNFWTILVTAIITAIATTASQQYLLKRRLASEQENWKHRYNVETIDQLNTQRLQMLEDISSRLLQLEIQAKEIKIQAAVSKYSRTVEQVDKLNDLLLEYHKDLYAYSAKIQQVSLFFGGEVDSLIPIIGNTLQMNFNNNLLIEKESIGFTDFDLDFETIDTLSNMRNALSQEMVDEIFESFQLKDQL